MVLGFMINLKPGQIPISVAINEMSKRKSFNLIAFHSGTCLIRMLLIQVGALVTFSAYDTKEFGKTVSANQFQVKDVRWNSELGGQDMELRLVEYFADEFNKQMGNEVDVRKFPKAMAKLKKQVKRTKEILSANRVAPISVESIHDDRDLRFVRSGALM